MTAYCYIEELFRNVLKHSTVMQGRLHVCPRWGQEVNTDELQTIIKDVVKPVNGVEYPVALLMPPSSDGEVNDLWRRYRIEMYFLATTYYTGTNQVKQANRKTFTSNHTIQQDWEDMHRCALDFTKKLDGLSLQLTPDQLHFRFIRNEKVEIDPVSLTGNDRLSGVRIAFKVDLVNDCEVEDYAEDITVEIPSFDIHPTHKH